MAPREALHRLIDELPEEDLSTASRVLGALQATSDPLLRALASAPADDEPDRDDADGGLTEAREQAATRRVLSNEELRRTLGLP